MITEIDTDEEFTNCIVCNAQIDSECQWCVDCEPDDVGQMDA